MKTMQKVRPLDTHFFVHGSVCRLPKRWRVHCNVKMHSSPEFPEV